MNAQTPRPLFRPEVLKHRADRLHGDVSLALPMSWQIIGFTLLAALVVALGFLASASYSRVETVGGAVALDTGVAAIMPSRAGVVVDLLAGEGRRVRAGDPLVRIRSGEFMPGGATAPERMRKALDQQDALLAGQVSSLMNASDAERDRLAAQVQGLENELPTLDAQVADQRRAVELAERQFADVQRIAANGFISRRDLEARESALLVQRQQLSQLEQARIAKRSSLAEGRRGIAQARSAAQAQAAGAQSSRAELAQRMAEVDAAQGYTLTSPVAGVVTGVLARLGQPADAQQALMMVVPEHSRARAELYVPTAAAGFLAPGQEVRLAVDAFPYQRFGTIKAQVTEISSAALTKTNAQGATVPVYLVTARLSEPWVTAFGRRQPLLPGMALSARIVTRKQSLLEWLFEPLFAVRKR